MSSSSKTVHFDGVIFTHRQNIVLLSYQGVDLSSFIAHSLIISLCKLSFKKIKFKSSVSENANKYDFKKTVCS